jgi:hypothetical protein
MDSKTNLPGEQAGGRSDYVQPNVGGVVSKISLQARLKMLATLMDLAQPTEATRVLDVGVTSDQREDSNFFEKYYPYWKTPSFWSKTFLASPISRPMV